MHWLIASINKKGITNWKLGGGSIYEPITISLIILHAKSFQGFFLCTRQRRINNDLFYQTQ